MKDRKILPEGWKWVRIGDVCELITGSITPHNTPSETFAHYSIPAFDEGMIPTIEKGEKILSNKTCFTAPCILFSKLNPRISRVWLVTEKLKYRQICSTEFLPLKADERYIDFSYLVYVLQAPTLISKLRKQVAAATKSRERLSPEIILNSTIPLPPVDEQHRIATRIRKQLAAVSKAKKAAEEQMTLLDKYVSRVIESAFSADRFADCKWVKLGDYTSKVGSGATPRGGQASYQKEGIALIRSQNVHFNRFEYNGLAFITQEQNAALANSIVQQGDILLNITGASIGRVCVVPDTICPANVNQHVCIIRPTKEFLPEFISYFIANPSFQTEILNLQSGATRQALTKEQIQNFELPLIGVEQQKAIVDEVKNKLNKVSDIRNKLNEQLAAIIAMPTAIFRKVFNGEI